MRRVRSDYGTWAVASATEARASALRIAFASLQAVDPARRLRERVRFENDVLSIDSLVLDLAAFDRILVVGAGKATYAMATAIESIIGPRITDGFVAVKLGQVGALRPRYGELSRIRVIECGHPLPNDASFSAGREVLRMTRHLGRRDLVLCLMSGGISSLCVAPVQGVSQDAMHHLFELLVHSGADTTEMMTVRGHLSAITSGRLGWRMGPATVVGLCVSDERNDGMAWCSSWTVSDGSSAADALDVLHRYDLALAIPRSVIDLLSRLGSATDQRPVVAPMTTNFMLVATRDLWSAASAASRESGLAPYLLTTTLGGESAQVGRVLGSIAAESAVSGNPMSAPCAFIALGETTVAIPRGVQGVGGPNQELAAGAALALCEIGPGHDVSLCALDTDGTDGPTDVAGALVDPSSVHRADALGLDLACALREHDTSSVLERTGDAILTGHTGTNTNDLVISVVLPRLS